MRGVRLPIHNTQGELTMTQKAEITSIAIDVLKNNPAGLQQRDLIHEIGNQVNYTKDQIRNAVWDIADKFPEQIYRPREGFYMHADYKGNDLTGGQAKVKGKNLNEEKNYQPEDKFYQPFADWLMDDVGDTTTAFPLGGKKFLDKWATPDVVGVKESKKSDMISGQDEIVSAEIKSNTQAQALIEGFGQACAYKLFSHKCYLVIPQESSQNDLAKLDSLCQLLGVGLVLFDAGNPEEPNFQIRARPQKHEPDLFYTNDYMKKIEENLYPNKRER